MPVDQLAHVDGPHGHRVHAAQLLLSLSEDFAGGADPGAREAHHHGNHRTSLSRRGHARSYVILRNREKRVSGNAMAGQGVALEVDGQRRDPVEDQAGTPWPVPPVARPGAGRESGEQRAERDPGLQPGQRRAEAVVDAVAEGQVRRVGAGDVERVGVGRSGPGRGWRPAARRPRSRRPGSSTPPISTGSRGPDGMVATAPARRSAAAPRPRPVEQLRLRAQQRQLVGVGAAARSTPLPIRFTVVSWPATSSRKTIEVSSSSVSRSPPSRTATSAESRSSAGFGALGADRAPGCSRPARWPRRSTRRSRPCAPGDQRRRSRPRNSARSVVRDAEQLADHGDRQRVGERVDQVDLRRCRRSRRAARR